MHQIPISEGGIQRKSTLSLSQALSPSLTAEPTVTLDRVFEQTPSRNAAALGLKRALDIGVSGSLLLAFALPMLLIAVLVKLTSRGPAFYIQERIGQHGTPFRLFKFRSMRLDAEQESGPVWAVRNDTRQTLIGRFLRRYCLDELPQLWNVLKGDMSLVGPRPERPVFVRKFAQQYPAYPLRHAVHPGLTGWAQVNGWYGDSNLQARLSCDLDYIENWSLKLDLTILLVTPWRVLRGHNDPEPS